MTVISNVIVGWKNFWSVARDIFGEYLLAVLKASVIRFFYHVIPFRNAKVRADLVRVESSVFF